MNYYSVKKRPSSKSNFVIHDAYLSINGNFMGIAKSLLGKKSLVDDNVKVLSVFAVTF